MNYSIMSNMGVEVHLLRDYVHCCPSVLTTAESTWCMGRTTHDWKYICSIYEANVIRMHRVCREWTKCQRAL